MYDAVEAKLEKELGLPSGGIAAIRTRGERSNADQVSPVGARTVYQIMPNTRRLFLNKYGVDAYKSPEDAARVAGLHLKESMDRNGGDWAAAVGEYHGGPDRSKWGRVNSAYRNRVLGGNAMSSEGGSAGVPALAPRVPTVAEMLGSTPEDLFADTEDSIREAKRAPRPKLPTVSDLVTAQLAEGMQTTPVDLTPDTTDQQTGERLEAEQTELDSYGHWDRFKAGFMENTILGEIIDSLDRESFDDDPEFNQFYLKNWQQIEGFAQTGAEVAQIRDAKSADHLAQIQREIEQTREREKIISTASSPTLLAIGAGILDPGGWAAGLGVGKAAQLAGVGSRALAVAGRPVAALASGAVEGAVGNVAVTAGMDAAGSHMTGTDYTISGLSGLFIGFGLTGVTNRLARNDIAQQQVDQAIKARKQYRQATEASVREQLGDAASPETVQEAVTAKIRTDYMEVLDYALADVPEHQKVMLTDELLMERPDIAEQVKAAGDTEGVSDTVERLMVEETVARSQRIADANPVDRESLKTILAKVGQEATSTRLLLSESPVARAVAVSLLENPQGAAGRHRSAALTAFMRERVYNEQFAGFDDLHTQFRRRNGVGAVKDFWDGRSRNEFNRRVFQEIERRGNTPKGTRFDENPYVVEAADAFEAGMEKMRLEQQKAGTIGNARLGDNSVGYVPHRLDPRKVASLNAKQMQSVRNVLSAQFQRIEGFDAAFSDQLAARYLERGIDAANGMYQVPFNLHSPEAGQIVKDALEAMKLDPSEVEKIMGKFSRGGAGHTKSRLKLDLMEDIGDGKQLMDLFVTDIPSLYRSYARRVAGEVSLAQYGVMGKKGLDILKKAMIASDASPQEVKAFDQIAAEFLNTPFGEANWRNMDNLRLATSASRLGGMAFTQLAEFGNAIPSLGVSAALRSVGNLPRMMKEVREIAAGHGTPNEVLKSLDQMGGGVGMDDYWMTRMFDVRDNEVELYNGSDLGIVTRAVRAGAHANMIMSGHRNILAAQTRLMSEEVLRKAIRFAKSGEADTALDDMGISAALRGKLQKDMDRIATFDAKGNLTGLDLFKGSALKPEDVNELVQAVERGSAQIIQRTFTGETGQWAHDGFLKLLLQFRTFSVTSVEKQWGRNMRNHGAVKSFTYLMAAMSFALPIHLARMQAKMTSMSDRKREDYWEKNGSPLALTRATMNYASSAGLAGDILDLGVGMATGWIDPLDEALGDTYGHRAGGDTRLLGGVAAPGAGLAQDLYSGTFGGDPDRLLRALPGSNLPYVAPLVSTLADLGDD
ncbi:transglycosylase SLT domain-containing protein [Qipengyuania sp. GH25]|uniref:Transglycosylase SLT domain-containing protein n=1 Tax=Qipengyuania pacifica TaxID=2860199 RepID=A0ABS7JIA1_9SPHN|nr:transglycosylase SLT domain-containing protein [Qipengyuania aerophila]MBX7488841.1 transglycosylase SLT domain-containing protein [Qipengyuania aerophila]